MEEYGPTMKRSVVNLRPIEPTAVVKILDQMPNSAPGLDQVLISELKVAFRWSSQLVHTLVLLLTAIETHARWPRNLTKGVVAFIPKDTDNPQPKPDEFRPITILSTLYRIWSAVRHADLADRWFPHWQHPSTYGGKKSRSADQLALDTCLQYEQAVQNGKFAAGLSFDLQKCFDTIPYMLAFDVFAARGADLRVVSTLKSFYQTHHKHFRLEGDHTYAFKPSCGIVQGCPLSMILHTSFVTCWSEKNHGTIPSSINRSYADDLSIVTESTSKKAVQDQLNLGYKSTEKFSKLAGMKINMKKTFTFGVSCFKKCVPSITEHNTTFRLVGCSVKTTPAPMWTPLEKQRFASWKQTVQRIRVLPVSWQHKCQVIQSMMPKLSFGQGMHVLHVSKETSRAMRAAVMRTLLDADNYNSSPNAVFALLTSPSIDPLFALDLAAFNLFRRTFQTNEEIADLQSKIHSHTKETDGPITRLIQLQSHPVFAKTIAAFLDRTLHPSKWQHLLREDYRLNAWQVLCRDRAQHFAGTWHGVDRSRTLALLNELIAEADILQVKCDREDFLIDDPQADPRAKLKVLRLLLTGGLQNPERQHRHKKKDGTVVCLCKQGEPSV